MVETEHRGFQNSLGPNVLTDDLVAMNYKAFASWVVINNCLGKKVGISKICKAYDLYSYETFKTKDEDGEEIVKVQEAKFNNSAKYIVKNIKTNEETICNGTVGVSKLIGINTAYVSRYASKGSKYKHTYTITKIGSGKAIYKRAISLVDVKTGDEKIIESVLATSKLLNVSTSTVKAAIDRNREVKGYKVKYAD